MMLCTPWRRNMDERFSVGGAEKTDVSEKRFKTPSWDEEAASPAKRRVTQQVRLYKDTLPRDQMEERQLLALARVLRWLLLSSGLRPWETSLPVTIAMRDFRAAKSIRGPLCTLILAYLQALGTQSQTQNLLEPKS